MLLVLLLAAVGIVAGGLVLAVVTSLPNAVSAVYLARRGRGAAVLSTALNSNAINVVGGLLIPASLAGLGPGSGQDTLVAAWYAGLTVLALALAYRGRGLGRASGTAIIAGYLAFVTALVITVEQGGVRPAAAVFPAAAVAAAGALLLTWPTQWRTVPARPGGLWQRESVLPGWSIGRLWRLSLILCGVVAACDAASGPHLILIGLLFGSWLHWRLFVAIFSLFLLTFCFQFSEEALANHKFLNIWLVVANLFVGYGLWRLWRLGKRWWSIPSRLLAIILVAPIVAGGIIDLFPIHNATFIQTGVAGDRLIKWIQADTKPDAIFLTDKFVNHPILLAGRKIFFGYTYFTWSAGYDLPKREAAYRLMFESKNAHQVFTLLKANHIDYVAYDSTVRGAFKNNNEQQVYVPNFKKVFEANDYWTLAIYKVPENADFIPAATSSGPGVVTAPGVSVFETGNGKENGQLNFPRGLAVDTAGNIFVADTNNDRLQKFSSAGNFLNVIGKRGQGHGEFVEPGGIAVDRNGFIYVADTANNRLQKLKPDGTFLAEWKGPEGGLLAPRDITIGADNSIYITDQGHSRIVKFDPDGRVMLVWGISGKGEGEFSGPTSVAVDGKNNRVYVADPSNGRIQIFDTNGKFVATWPVEEWGIPSGWQFQDLLVDSQTGRVYASSVASDEVLAFDLTGKKMAHLRPKPPDRLEGASGLALVKGKLYVLNTYAGRVSLIELEIK
jgi:DNA-binding beta-propeller fold protein YncE